VGHPPHLRVLLNISSFSSMVLFKSYFIDKDASGSVCDVIPRCSGVLFKSFSVNEGTPRPNVDSLTSSSGGGLGALSEEQNCCGVCIPVLPVNKN